MEVVDNRTMKQKLHEFRVRTGDKIAIGWHNTKVFVRENKTFCLGIAAVAIPEGLRIGNSLIRHHQASMELKRRDTDIWDPKRGMHYYIKKRMTPSQQMEYNRRYDRGENGADILRSMRLL